MSAGSQFNSRSEKERLRAALKWLRTRNHQQQRTIEKLRQGNEELRVALQACDVLLGAAMDAVVESRRP
jgi:hypothetical protein